jgi:hypothetical protein
MEKKHSEKSEKPWTIDRLSKSTELIEFPEFQREPTVWKLEKKQRLIDSIFRGFDISSIYLYKRDDGKYDCIDGQQRINAIWSYMGINKQDPDNEFFSKIENEVYNDERQFIDVDQKKFVNLNPKYKEQFNNYLLNIVFIIKIKDEDELNLQFIRLQLGAPLRAGEKLNAMKGDMRDLIFNKIKNEFMDMDYFNKTSIRKGRFGRQEVAAQILLNAFSKKETDEFHRSRYDDLQEFFKIKENFSAADKRVIEDVIQTLRIIESHFDKNLMYINNKALAVSVFLFVNEMRELKREKEIKDFVEFLIKFLKTKQWQVSKGLDMNKEYRDILNYQTSLTQAANEKTAIQNRHDFWRTYFTYYKKNRKQIIGDEEYKKIGDAEKEREKYKLLA